METENIVKDIDQSGDQSMLDDSGAQDESGGSCGSKDASTAAGDKQSGSSGGSSSGSSSKHNREDDGKRKARGRDSDGKDVGGRGREQDRRGGRSGDRDRSRDRSRRDSSRDRERHREGRGGHSGEVCRNFLNNRCFRGTLCKFRHPSPERGGGGGSGGDGDDDNASSSKGEKEVSKTQQHEDVVCRDFLRNMCQRGSECRFYHPESKEQEKRSWLTFCHDFQNGRCYRTDCRFFHVTPEDEGYYHRTGNISVHIVDQAMRKALMLDVSLMGTRPVCKDYLKGLCTHQTCRFRHLTRREYEHEVYLALESEFEKTLGSPKHLEGSDAKRMRLDSRERDPPATDIARTGSPVTTFREDYSHRIDESRPYRYTGERTERDDTNQYSDRFVDSSFRSETRSLSHSPDLSLREGGMKNIMRENCNMLKVEIDELRKENSFLRRENVDLRRTVDQQSSQIQDKIRRIMRENDDLKSELQKKGGTEKAELLHKLKKTESENIDLKMSLSRAQDKIDQLVSEADKAKSSLNELKSKLESLETMNTGQNQGNSEYWNSQGSQMYSSSQNSYTYQHSVDRSYAPPPSSNGSSALGCQEMLGASSYISTTGLLPTPSHYGSEGQGSMTPRRGQTY